MEEAPIRKYALLLLFQSQQDHATELAVSPTDRDPSPIRYKVGGTWYHFSRPPADLLPHVVAELGRLAAFTKRPFPKEGLIDVPYSGVRLLWVLRMASPEADCMLTPVEQ
jgi:hypothetical protein